MSYVPNIQHKLDSNFIEEMRKIKLIDRLML